MTPLSQLMSDALVERLRECIHDGAFPGLDFETAMEFVLTDGVLPASGLPADSFLRLEEWMREQSTVRVQFTATELKNKTGLVLEQVLSGRDVTITKHGRPIAVIRPAG